METHVLNQQTTPAEKQKHPREFENGSPSDFPKPPRGKNPSSPGCTIKKLTIDFKESTPLLSKLQEICQKVNDKTFGRNVSRGEILYCALEKITDADIKNLQEGSLSTWDKIKLAHQQYNEKNNIQCTLEEYLATKLKIQ